MRIKSLAPIVLDSFVVVIVVTVIAAIAALLPFASIHRKTTYIVCVLIALLGTASIIYQMWRLHYQDRTKELISDLLADGIEITQSVNDNVAQGQEMIRDWCQRVEAVLRERLGESYVRRFHLGGSNIQGPKAMSVWKNNHRLETLAAFLRELN